MTYIEREALLEVLESIFEATCFMSACGTKEECNDRRWLMALVSERVKELPAADVVPVVRCRDCIYNGLHTCPLAYIEKQALQFVNRDPNFFCANGLLNNAERED